MTQGAVVLLITDGLDREAAEGLAEQMQRLHKSCRRLIWLNPLLRYDAFQPKSSGARAMLPHVDDFRPVHSLESLGDLRLPLEHLGHAACDRIASSLGEIAVDDERKLGTVSSAPQLGNDVKALFAGHLVRAEDQIDREASKLGLRRGDGRHVKDVAALRASGCADFPGEVRLGVDYEQGLVHRLLRCVGDIG